MQNENAEEEQRMIRRIHIIDADCYRRARVARELSVRRLHAEIYEDVAEFRDSKPSVGFIFAADDDQGDTFSEIARAMDETTTGFPVVIYAPQPVTEMIVQAMLAGALDYLEWPFRPELLDATLRRLDTEGNRKLQQERLRSAARKKVDQLSPRERDVLFHLVAGLSNREIAEALKISPRTVEIHRGNMMRKLDAQSPADAVRIAIYAGVDDDFQFAPEGRAHSPTILQEPRYVR